MVRVILIIACLMLEAKKTEAADLHVNEHGAIVLIGPIEEGDDEKFRKLAIAEIKKPGGKGPLHAIHIYSPGGNLRTAMKIGEQVNLLQLATYAPELDSLPSQRDTAPRSGRRICEYIPGEAERLREQRKLQRAEFFRDNEEYRSARAQKRRYVKIESTARAWTFDPSNGEGDARCTCASACFFIWAAGSRRDGGVVEIHRPYFNPVEYATLKPSEARSAYDGLISLSKEYLNMMGVPDGIIARMFSISSAAASYLSVEEMAGLKHNPAFRELEIAMCGGDADAMKGAIPEDAPPSELRKKLIERLDQAKCEILASQELLKQTNAEYLEKYDRK